MKNYSFEEIMLIKNYSSENAMGGGVLGDVDKNPFFHLRIYH